MLGPLEVQEGENTLQLGGPKQRTLLALLLLRAGEVVSVDALTDALWGDQPPRTSPTAIHNFVAEVRKLLGPERLVTRAPGYVLQVEDDELDVQQVRRLVAAAKVAPAEERVELLRRAESLLARPAAPGVRVRRVRADRDRADGGAPPGGDARTGSQPSSSSIGTRMPSPSSRGSCSSTRCASVCASS